MNILVPCLLVFTKLRSKNTNVNVQSLINDLFIKQGRYLDISEWSPKDESEDFVWVDGQWLRRYLKNAKYPIEANESTSSTPSSLKISQPEVSLCEHGKIRIPSNSQRGKWIKRSIYDAIEKIPLENNLSLFREIETSHKFEPKLKCSICDDNYFKTLREKFALFREIHSVTGRLDRLDDYNNSDSGFYVSKAFLTDFRKRVANMNMEVLKTRAIGSFNFDNVISSTEQLNFSITCNHGKLAANDGVHRIAKVVSQDIWDVLKSLFPGAIELQVSNGVGTDPICDQCQNNRSIIAQRGDMKKHGSSKSDRGQLQAGRNVERGFAGTRLNSSSNVINGESHSFIVERGLSGTVSAGQAFAIVSSDTFPSITTTVHNTAAVGTSSSITTTPTANNTATVGNCSTTSITINDAAVPEVFATDSVNATNVAACTTSSTCSPSCVICMELLQDGTQIKVLSCYHVFHRRCIKEAWKKRIANQPRRCPICREVYSSEAIQELEEQSLQLISNHADATSNNTTAVATCSTDSTAISNLAAAEAFTTDITTSSIAAGGESSASTATNNIAEGLLLLNDAALNYSSTSTTTASTTAAVGTCLTDSTTINNVAAVDAFTTGITANSIAAGGTLYTSTVTNSTAAGSSPTDVSTTGAGASATISTTTNNIAFGGTTYATTTSVGASPLLEHNVTTTNDEFQTMLSTARQREREIQQSRALPLRTRRRVPKSRGVINVPLQENDPHFGEHFFNPPRISRNLQPTTVLPPFRHGTTVARLHTNHGAFAELFHQRNDERAYLLQLEQKREEERNEERLRWEEEDKRRAKEREEERQRREEDRRQFEAELQAVFGTAIN